MTTLVTLMGIYQNTLWLWEFVMPLCFIFYGFSDMKRGILCWLYTIRIHSIDLWVISIHTCESNQVLCILIWLRWWCCIVKFVSNIKLRPLRNIKSSILIERTLWEWISNCGDNLVLYQDSRTPFVKVVILCDILLVTITECYKSCLGISYP